LIHYLPPSLGHPDVTPKAFPTFGVIQIANAKNDLDALSSACIENERPSVASQLGYSKATISNTTGSSFSSFNPYSNT
jgi:hypothetical protein